LQKIIYINLNYFIFISYNEAVKYVNYFKLKRIYLGTMYKKKTKQTSNVDLKNAEIISMKQNNTFLTIN